MSQKVTALSAVLSDLGAAENNICNLLRLAEETCSELEKAPLSDPEVLNKLATDYFENIKEMRSLVVKHVAYISAEESTTEDTRKKAEVQKQLDRIESTINDLNAAEDALYSNC